MRIQYQQRERRDGHQREVDAVGGLQSTAYSWGTVFLMSQLVQVHLLLINFYRNTAQ